MAKRGRARAKGRGRGQARYGGGPPGGRERAPDVLRLAGPSLGRPAGPGSDIVEDAIQVQKASVEVALKAADAAREAASAAAEAAVAVTPAAKSQAVNKAQAAARRAEDAAVAVDVAATGGIVAARGGPATIAERTGLVSPGQMGGGDASTAGNAGGGRTMQGIPTFVGGSHIPLDTTSDFGDKMIDTQKVTAGYFTGGGGTLDNSLIYTGSLSAANEKYYFNITQTHPESASAATQFSIAYGHKGGSGSNTDSNNLEGETEAIYEQWAATLLAENEISGGFNISKTGTSGVHSTTKDEDIYVLVGKRARYKDRINKKNWTIALSGSRSIPNPNPSGALLLKLTDDSNTTDGTATVAGTRYNIVSGSDGTVYVAASTRTFGWFYPEMGVMIFSAAELSSSIPGTADGINMTASFEHQPISKASLNSQFASCSGFAANVNAQGNQQNALRFVNCLQPDGAYMKFRSEEDQVSVSYFCRVKAQQLNFSNSPTFVSGSFNELVHRSMWGNPTSYITGVGLYNDMGQLVAIGKLSTPLKKNFSSEATIKVKLTY